MSVASPEAAALAGLQARFPELPLDCGRPGDPGIVERGAWADWVGQETTPDQLRIERYIDRYDLTGRAILHIGCGNSGLAARFAPRARSIVGTTVTPEELRHGREWIERSGTANYRVLLHNKYLGREGMTDERFDFIVDNNPSTFACCLIHFARMMEFYAGALAPGGQIVTDRLGLGWSMAHSDPRWGFDAADIAAFGRMFSLQTHAVGADIIVLAHGAPPRPPLRGWVAHGMRGLGRRLKLRSRRPQPG
jgi:hypothetical protein